MEFFIDVIELMVLKMASHCFLKYFRYEGEIGDGCYVDFQLCGSDSNGWHRAFPKGTSQWQGGAGSRLSRTRLKTEVPPATVAAAIMQV